MRDPAIHQEDRHASEVAGLKEVWPYLPLRQENEPGVDGRQGPGHGSGKVQREVDVPLRLRYALSSHLPSRSGDRRDEEGESRPPRAQS